jgi:excisionase family DNA binding protein
MTASAVVYAIENIRSSRVYVGSSKVGLATRWKHHQALLVRGVHRNGFLQRDWLRLGLGWFKCFVLEVLDDDTSLREREQYWMFQFIDEDRQCYNRISAHRTLRPRIAKRVPLTSDTGLTLKQAAKILVVSERTLVRLMKSGQFEGYRFGRHWRIPRLVIARMCEVDDDSLLPTGLPRIPYADIE